MILGGGLLRRAGSAAQQQALLPQVAQGKLKLAFAHVERQSRYDLADVATTARQDGAAGCWTAPRASCCTATAPTDCW